MSTLEGKVALITGGARGQGRSHARTLAQAGADVIVIDICADLATVPYRLASEAELAETAGEVQASGRKCVTKIADVRDSAAVVTAVDEAVAELGRLDIVVANAGVLSWGPVDCTPQQVFDDTIAVNLIGVWNTFEATVPHILEHGDGGCIVVIGSTNSNSAKTLEVSTAARAYVASKHGVIGLMRSYALQLSPLGIRVNAVEPCGVDTMMLTNDAAQRIIEQGGPYDMLNPMGMERIEPEDVSAAIEFLVSDRARYITGIEFPVDAGFGVK
ncbi:mycofactocin-coupled SDR family oxidoreductase [Rhodococcus marinonascens]|uniref:mycofactocin-coupled SDR family oxidoreductase n=1 Tax=Rhodococcus marinonascens TaxID=38311 RepID=UPI000934AFF5|nr:mycofactocin-coupled SDR family oxidoreductase [Rhodococcus marinonascens]